MKGFSMSTAGWALGVLLVCLLAHEAECSTELFLGGEVIGWRNTANINYNTWLSDYKIRIGDTLICVNHDTIAHSVVEVDKLRYDTCGEKGETINSVTINPEIQVSSHCKQGMKVAVQVLNADGSVNATDANSTPKANSAAAMPGFSWTSQLLIATVALVVAAFPVLA